MTSGKLWNYYRDQINDGENGTDKFRNRLNNNKTIRSKSFKHRKNYQEVRQTITR